MANTEFSDLTAAASALSTHEFAINEAGTTKRLTVDLLRAYIIQQTAAATVAAGAYITRLVLAANSSDITGVTQTDVMTITALPVGRYFFSCLLIYQTTATGTGIDVSVRSSGSTTQTVVDHRIASTGGIAATAAATNAGASATGNIYGAQQGLFEAGTKIGAGTVSVAAADSDHMSVIEGVITLSVTGNFRIQLAAESAGLVCRAMQGSVLELKRLS